MAKTETTDHTYDKTRGKEMPMKQNTNKTCCYQRPRRSRQEQGVLATPRTRKLSHSQWILTGQDGGPVRFVPGSIRGAQGVRGEAYRG